MPSARNIRVDAIGSKQIVMFDETDIDGTSALTGSSSTYSIEDFAKFDMMITVASYAGTGNITVSPYPATDANGTASAVHTTTSGNLSADGYTWKALGEINTKYIKFLYTVASGASATITATLCAKT